MASSHAFAWPRVSRRRAQCSTDRSSRVARHGARRTARARRYRFRRRQSGRLDAPLPRACASGGWDDDDAARRLSRNDRSIVKEEEQWKHDNHAASH